MGKTLTLSDVDLLISKLPFAENSEEKHLLSIFRSYYSTEQDLEEKRSIKSDEVVQKMWPYSEGYGKTEKNYFKDKRKVLSQLKSDINKVCRDLFWKDSNPERIGIGRFNTFTILKETKFDEVHHLKAELKYLKSIVSGIVPSAMSVVKGEGSVEDLKKIKEAVSNISGNNFEDAANLAAEENLHFEPLPFQEQLRKTFVYEESDRIAKKLEELNGKILKIKEKIESGELSEDEAKKQLEELTAEKEKTNSSAERLVEALDGVKEEDPKLAAVFEKIKKSLKEYIEKKGLKPEEDIERILEEGLKALERIDETEVRKDEAGYEDKENVEEDFKQVKEEAKVLLGKFKELHRGMKPLLEKKKTETGLTQDETKALAGYEAEFNSFKTEGERHLERLRKIEIKAQGALKESVLLIISALERFAGKSDVKQEVLIMIEKNKKVVDDLKGGGAKFKSEAGVPDLEKEKEEFLKIEKEYEKIKGEISRKKGDLIKAKEEKLHLEQELTHEGGNKGLNEKLNDAKDETHYLSVELEKILEETEAGMEQAIEDGTVEKLSKNLERITRKGQKIYDRIKSIVAGESISKNVEGEKLDEETAGDLLYVLNAESKKIVDQYHELNISYEKLQKDIEDKKVAVDRAKEEVDKLEEKRKFLETKAQAETEKIGEIEKKLGEGMKDTLHEALETARQNYSNIRKSGATLEGFSGKVVIKYREMERQAEAQPVIDIHEESDRIAKKLEEVNEKVLRIKESVEKGEITEEEGQRKLKELEAEREKTSRAAERLVEALEGMKEEENSEFSGVFEKIKKSLKEYIEKTGLKPEEDMGLILEAGLKALEKIEETQVGKDEAGYEGKETVEEEFRRVKEEAKVFLGQFKELSRAMKPLLEKKKTEAGLTEEETKLLAGYEVQFNAFKAEGENHLERLRKIETKAQGALKEAVVLIISALERFVGKTDVKQEVLMIVEKNKKVVDDLKEGGAKFKGTAGAPDLEKEKEEYKKIEKEYEKIKSEILRKKSDLIRAKEEKLHLDEELSQEGANKGLNEKLNDAKDETHYLSVELEKILEETEEGMEQAIEDGTVEKLSKNLQRITQKGQKIYERIKKIVAGEKIIKREEGNKLDEETAEDLLYVLNAESKKIVDQYRELNIAYEKLQKDIEEKKIAVDKAREEVDKLEEKRRFLETKAQAETDKISEIEKKLGEGMSGGQREAIETARNNYSGIKNAGVTLEGVSGKLVIKYKEMENDASAQPEINIQEESERIARTLEELNEKVLKIKERVEKGELNEEEGHKKLKELEAERNKTSNSAARLVEALEEVKEDDPKVAEIFDKIKKSLKEYIGKKGLNPEEDMERILEEGMKALERIEETEVGKDEAGYDGKESVEGEFKRVKEEAKILLGKFKELSRMMKPLLEKKKTEVGLTEDEGKALAGYEVQFNGFKTEGEKHLESLRKIETKAQGALKEAVVLIISSLERFVGKPDVKQEVLMIVEKNKKMVDDIHDVNKKIEKEREIIKKEIVYIPKEEGSDTAVDKTAKAFVENSRLVTDAKEQSLKILEQLEALNREAETIQTEISTGRLSEEQGQQRLAKINIEKRRIEHLEKKLYSAFNEIQQEKDMDPLLAKALDRIKSNLQNMILDKRIVDSDSLQALIDEGLKAMSEFEKGYSAEVKDSKEYDGKDTFEKQFEVLKEKAKKFLDEFRPLQKQISPLLEKSMTPEGLTPEENDSLNTLQERYAALQNEGEDILDHLIQIEEKAEGALKEAIKLIVSALKRFVGRKETKDEVLMLVNKNRNIADSLKDLDQEYNGIQQKIQSTKGAIIKAQEDSRMLEEQAEKLGIPSKGTSVSSSNKEIDVSNASKMRNVKISGMEKIAGRFWMDIYPVTFLQFKEFVDQTGYKTLAEKAEKSLVISKTGWVKLMEKGREKIVFQGVGASSKKGACWHNPDGDEASLMEFMKRLHYPAVHITYKDALAYAEWKKKRLPAREEWLLAAFGEKGVAFPWENIREIQKCNNKEAVFKNLSPVNYYLPNPFGLYDMIGNVWQWCESDDPDFKYIFGGCWNLTIKEMESQFEFKTKPLECNNTIGFRCVMD